MVNPDGFEGICGDREFVDCLYLYYKSKQYLNNSKLSQENEAEESRNICLKYLACIGRCFSKIQSLPHGGRDKMDYIHYLRWNLDIIETQLNTYECDPILDVFKERIINQKARFTELRATCFTLSPEELAIANQYIHAYNNLQRSTTINKKVVKHAAKLFINYVNNLANRCYTTKLDRENVSFSELGAEAQFLAKKLANVDSDLSKAVLKANDSYTDFRTFDDAARVGQDKQLETALLMAHERATETFLQSTLRAIRESIQEIKSALARKSKEIWDATTNVLSPFLNPTPSCKNIEYFLENPVQSTAEIYAWAKESPWKCCKVCLAGIAIGAIFGGIIVGGGALLLNSFVTMTINHIPYAMAGALGGAVGFVVAPIVVNGGQVCRLRHEAEASIAEKITEQYRVLKINEAAGKEIAMEAIYEEHMRESLRNTKEQVEKDIRERRRANQLLAEQRRSQIDSMDEERLRNLELQLNDNVDEITQNLEEIQAELRLRRREILANNIDIFTVTNAREAAARLLQNTLQN